MSDSAGDPASTDPVTKAAMRLEAAVEKLAALLAASQERLAAGTETVPRAEVAILAERLDATLGRLRLALAEELRGAPEEEEE
ncbi:hypothetical protein [Siccirubricoccus phaeus]|uniref:hypothetical protein n=1 Tax=Siccirubricoccus phaeus TaxID=2595053 RepID=UPI0011F15251|nr:hypothetical protein [Siccirubricoccus phaeus]